MIKENENDFDSSDEEDTQNTVGNIPLEWYADSNHMGYDISGRQIMKSSSAMKGEIDSFLNNVENKDKSIVIKDPNTGQNVILSEQDILFIKSICASRGAISSQINDDEYDDNWFTKDVMETPLTAHPPQKNSFIPSILDKKRVSRMVYAMKMGRMKIPSLTEEDREKVYDADHDFVMNMTVPDVWREDYNKRTLKNVAPEFLEWLSKELRPDYQSKYQGLRQILRPPPEVLPGHDESYNPPEEYLLDEKEKKAYISRFFDPSYNPGRQIGDKPLIPTVYPNLRSVPYSSAPILDKQRRLRDLAFGARMEVEKVKSSTETMLKQDIPPYSEMRPFPNTRGYNKSVDDVILSLSISYDGEYVAVIGYDFLSIYRTSTSESCSVPIRRRRYPVAMFKDASDSTETTLRNPSVSWNPYSYLLAVAVGHKVRIINPDLDTNSVDLELRMKDWWTNSVTTTDDDTEEPEMKKKKLSSSWSLKPKENAGHLEQQLSAFVIDLEEAVIDMSWHSCGDYLLTICGPGKATHSGGKVQLHRLSRCATQAPFGNSNKHMWLTARFHCQKNVPLLFLAECNSSNIQVYDLAQKKLVKTLQVTGSPSTMEMHPKENHLVVGTFEGKVCWFDLDMGITPFKTLNVNQSSVRSIALHKNYPLMTCTTANGSVVVFYTKVFSTFDQYPIIVPVHILQKLDKAGDMYSVEFHPVNARLICGGADKMMKEIVSMH